MKKELNITSILSGMLLVSLAGCNNNNADATKGNNAGDTMKAVSVTVNNTDEDVLPNLFQIGGIIKYSGLTYLPGLTAKVSDSKQFTTAYDRNLYLGIYFADLSYCTLNKQNQQSVDYLKAIKAISDDIGISQIFGSNSFQRYQDNLNNEDSLIALVADMQTKTDVVLKENKQYNFRIIIYSGAWIEDMYIGSKVYAKSNDSSAATHIIEEMNVLEKMLSVLNDFKSADQNMQGLYTDLKNVDDTYKGFDETKNYNPDNKHFAFTEEHLKKLASDLDGLHSKYVK